MNDIVPTPSPDVLIAQIAALSAEISAATAERETLLQQWARAVCPYVVGEEIRMIVGKMTRARVVSFRGSLSYWSFEKNKLRVVVMCQPLKKDGTLSDFRPQALDWQPGEPKRT